MGPFAFFCQFLFFQGTAHRHWQTRQRVFQHIIGDTLLDALHGGYIAQRAGYENQRDIAAFLAQNAQCLRASPLPQVVIGQNQIRTISPYVFPEFISRLYHIAQDLELTPPQLAQNQVSVVSIVFHEQHPKLAFDLL